MNRGRDKDRDKDRDRDTDKDKGQGRGWDGRRQERLVFGSWLELERPV
jgi:hypothetical protein